MTPLVTRLPARPWPWLALLLATAPGVALAQTGIGTTSPNPAAALDVAASDKGLLIPRLDSAQRVAIAAPPDGLMVFQKNGRVGLWYCFGGTWFYIPDKVKAGDNLGNHTATQNLNLTNQLLVGNGGTAGIGISNSGNVGVGFANPSFRLQVGGSLRSAVTNGNFSIYGNAVQSGTVLLGAFDGIGAGPQVRFAGALASVSYLDLGQDATGNFVVQTNDVPRLTILGRDNGATEGNVGIGFAAPTQKLHVGGNAVVSGRIGVGNTAPTQALDVTGSAVVSGNAVVNGNVGIGINPTAKLHVSGNIRADMAYGSFTLNNFSPSSIETVLLGSFAGTNNNAPQLRFEGVGTTRMDIGQDSSGAFVVEGNDSPRLTVQRLGNVGVGTSTPAARLDVQGGADSNGANNPGGVALSYRTGGYRHFMRSRHNGNVTGSGNAVDFYLNNSSTAVGSTAAGTGNIQVLTLESNNGLPRVGIGTTAPATTLEVSGATSTVRLGGLAGTGNRLVTVDASGNLTSSATLPVGVTGDNLGNHTATQALNLQGNALTGTGASIGAVVGLGVRADGGLNIGQNTSNNLFMGYLAGAATTPGGGLVGTNNVLVYKGQSEGYLFLKGKKRPKNRDSGQFRAFLGFLCAEPRQNGCYLFLPIRYQQYPGKG